MRRTSQILAGFTPGVTIITGTLVLLLPMILSGKTIFWGTIVTQFLPWRVYAWQTLLSGDIPLWNPMVGAGAPLLANYQSALLYPPNWFSLLFYALGGLRLAALGETLLLWFHLLWAGIGMSLLARQLGVTQRGQAVSGLAFGLGSYLVSRGSFASLVAAASWMPWVLLCVERLVHPGVLKRRKVWLQLAIVVAMMLLAGHAQTSWYILLLAAAWALLRSYQIEAGGWRKSLGVLVLLGLACLAAALLASAQLLPTYEYLRFSPRASEVDYEIAMTYSYWPWRLLTLLAPNIFGNPAHGDYWGYASYWEDAAYIGLLPLILALSAVWNRMRKREQSNQHGAQSARQLTPFLIIVIVIAFIFALGQNTPVFPFLYRNVPTFDMFKSPARYMLWGVFSLALLAAFGAQNWVRPTAKGLYWTRLATAGGFAITLGAGGAWLLIGDVSPTFIKASLWAGILAVGAGLLSLSAPPNPGGDEAASDRDRLWEALLGAFIVLDLVVAGWGLNPGISVNGLVPMESTEGASLGGAESGRLYLPADVEYELKFERYFLFKDYSPPQGWDGLLESGLPNINMLSQSASLNNFDPLIPGRYGRWMEVLERIEGPKWDELLNLSAAGMVGNIDSVRLSGIDFREVQHGGRARWLPCAVFAEDGEDALQLLLNETIDLSDTIILEDVEPVPQPGCARREGSAQAYLTKESSTFVEAYVNAPSDGWFLLADSLYPGWGVQLDGQQVDILTADYLFRGVWVPSGEHTVTFRYRPRSFFIGLGISLATLLLMAGLGMREARVKPGERAG